MRSRTKAKIGVAVWMGAGVSMGALIGNTVSGERYEDEMERIENAQAEIEDINASQLRLDYTRDEITADVGESCLRLLNQYTPDGRLSGTDEDTIVSDLLQIPGQPCGDASTDVRADVRDYISSADALAESQAREDKLNDRIADIQEDTQGTGSNRVEDITIPAGLFLAITTAFSPFVYMTVKDFAFDNPRDGLPDSRDHRY